jgi:hypothetical protein
MFGLRIDDLGGNVRKPMMSSSGSMLLESRDNTIIISTNLI